MHLDLKLMSSSASHSAVRGQSHRHTCRKIEIRYRRKINHKSVLRQCVNRAPDQAYSAKAKAHVLFYTIIQFYRRFQAIASF